MQANIVSSILNNGELLQQVYDESLKSAGSAMQEQNRWADSLEAKAQHIEAVFESISTKVLDSESLKKIMDSVGDLLEKVESLVSNGQGLSLLGKVMGGILGGTGNGIVNVNTTLGYWKDIHKYLTEYRKAALQGADAANAYATSIEKDNAALSQYLVGLNGANTGIIRFGLSTVAAGIKAAAFKIIITGLNIVLNSLIFALAGTFISALSKAANKNKELTESLKDSSEQIQNITEDLDSYKTKIDEIIKSDKTEAEKLEELNSIKDTLHDKYQTEIKDLKDTKQARDELNKAIENETISQLNDYINNPDNVKAYEYAKTRLNDKSVSYELPSDMKWNDFSAWGEYLKAGFQNLGDQLKGDSKDIVGEFSFEKKKGVDYEKQISKDITDLFDSFDIGEKTISFGIDFNGDEEEYFKKLKTLYDEFASLRALRVDDLTDEEEKIFQMVNYQYTSLKENNEDYISNVKAMAEKIAEYMVAISDRNYFQSDDAFFTYLSRLTSDAYVLDALKEIVYNTKEAVSNIEKAESPLTSVLGNIEKINSALNDVDEKIEKADEKFEDLLKTIESNNDTDKFFTSSEIIEILDKYPSLNDAIMECTYGYKIQSDALEELRKSKLEEEKTALQTQLSEAKGLLLATKEKLSAYEAELSEIKNVADAKIKLAELEAKLANIQSSATLPHIKQRQVNTVEEQIGDLKDYISASEGISDAEERMKALQVQINVLGQDHEKLSDSTNDATKALNAEKDAISDLNDAMKDAQEDINNLLELTMAMIKKNAELQKEALKERLDEYKKLIDKQKELIDLEKEEADFKSDLAEKDKNYLKIQQELDALSIEGASYSLEDMKRKEELTEELAEKEKDRTDFLYDHEVDVRKDALDKEADAFEDQINTQTKAIEDYLDHEGKIRQDAVDLINSKSQEFYNDLLSYTMNYTDKSRYEFEQLWTKAYDAIMKYANGQLNVDLALMNLMVELELNEQKLKDIEAQTDSLKETTTNYIESAKNGYSDLNKVLNETKGILSDIGNAPTINASDLTSWQNVGKASENYAKWVYDAKKILGQVSTKAEKHHSGGIVGGVSNEHGEVLTKLLKGEVVVTEGQARNFMENTLPKLTGNVTTNNSSIAPVINMGDINISGNADKTTVNQIKSIQKSIVDDVFKAINNQKNIFNGGRVRTV